MSARRSKQTRNWMLKFKSFFAGTDEKKDEKKNVNDEVHKSDELASARANDANTTEEIQRKFVSSVDYDLASFKRPDERPRAIELKQIDEINKSKDNRLVNVRESHAISAGYQGYDIGDVHVAVPVSCIGTFIGSVSDAIRLGKYELAHGLVLNENNEVKISLKEMKKYGYIPPEGYEINEDHDTLIPKFATAFEHYKFGLYRLKVPSGFQRIDDGEYEGEFVPVDPELLASIQNNQQDNT